MFQNPLTGEVSHEMKTKYTKQQTLGGNINVNMKLNVTAPYIVQF